MLAPYSSPTFFRKKQKDLYLVLWFLKPGTCSATLSLTRALPTPWLLSRRGSKRWVSTFCRKPIQISFYFLGLRFLPVQVPFRLNSKKQLYITLAKIVEEIFAKKEEQAFRSLLFYWSKRAMQLALLWRVKDGTFALWRPYPQNSPLDYFFAFGEFATKVARSLFKSHLFS